MTKKNVNINSIIHELRGEFPFPDLIDETQDTIKSIAGLLSQVVPVGGRVLDLGCGALDKASVYQKMGYQCYCADDFLDTWHKNPNNFYPVSNYAESIGIEIHSQSEPLELPWEIESFDAVTIINVIEHLHESPRELLNLAGHYLKSGGVLIVGMPNSVNLRKRISVLFGNSNYTPVQGLYEFDGLWRGHTREYTLKETCQIVTWTGFEVIFKSTFHGLLMNRLANKTARSLFKSLCMIAPGFRDSILVAARKPANWKPRVSDGQVFQTISGHEGFA